MWPDALPHWVTESSGHVLEPCCRCQPGMEAIEVEDWSDGAQVQIKLDPRCGRRHRLREGMGHPWHAHLSGTLCEGPSSTYRLPRRGCASLGLLPQTSRRAAHESLPPRRKC